MNKFIKVKVKKPDYYFNINNDNRAEHGAIVELAFSNKGTQFVSGDLDGIVRANLSKATTFKLILELTKALESIQEVGTLGVEDKITVDLSNAKNRRSRKKK